MRAGGVTTQDAFVMPKEENFMQLVRERLDPIGKVAVIDVATGKEVRYWAVDAISELRAGRAVMDASDLVSAQLTPSPKPATKPTPKPAAKAAAAAEPKTEG